MAAVFERSTQKWVVRKMIKHRLHFIGRYATQEEAEFALDVFINRPNETIHGVSISKATRDPRIWAKLSRENITKLSNSPYAVKINKEP